MAKVIQRQVFRDATSPLERQLRVSADKKLDTDDPDHIEWLYQQASARATEFKIEGVTWSLTQGVVKNIIPAIASTNAIIAGERPLFVSDQSRRVEAFSVASCCNEAFKIVTTCAPFLDNYMMVSRPVFLVFGMLKGSQYSGSDSVYTYTFQYDKRPDCPVCGGESLSAEVGRDWTLERFVDWLAERQDM